MGRLSRTVTHEGIYTKKDGTKVEAYIKYFKDKGWIPYSKTSNMPISNVAFLTLVDMPQFKLTTRTTIEEKVPA